MDIKNIQQNEFVVLNSCCFRPTILKPVWLPDDDPRVRANKSNKLQVESVLVDDNLWGVNRLIDNGIDSEECFCDEKCKAIYKAMLSLHKRKEQINIVTLGLELNSSNPEALRLMADLFDRELTRNIDHYIENMIATKTFLALHREIKIIDGKMVTSNDVNDSEIYERIARLKDHRERTKHEKFRTDKGATHKWIQNILDSEENKVLVYKTGIESIDNAINGGVLLTKLITIAARTGCGKTALATNLMLSLARQGARCLYISMELTENEILNRVISASSLVGISKFSTIDFTESEMDRVVHFTKELSTLPLTINSHTKAKWSAIESAIRIEKEINELKFVFIDYIQQCSVHGKQNKREEIEFITNECKQMALELDITIFICAQLNREAEKGEDKKPMLCHIKDSGSIEQDSDIVMLLYNDAKKSEEDKMLKIRFAKNRSGSSDNDITLHSDLSINKFFSKEDEQIKYRYRK